MGPESPARLVRDGDTLMPPDDMRALIALGLRLLVVGAVLGAVLGFWYAVLQWVS